MKRTLLVLPLAILLANCSSTRSTSSTNSGSTTSQTTAATAMNNGASASASITSSDAAVSSSTSSSATSGNWNNKSTATTSFSTTTNWDVYDPNNYMQNPDKYLRPRDLGKTGGWTYNKDWRRNTNFTQEAVGQWQLVLTPEVAANWMPDTRRPETYASFWTPEAIMSRYQASMAAAAKTRDSLAALNATANGNTSVSGRKGRRQSMATNGTAATESWSANSAMSGSGTTGAMATGGLSSTSAEANAGLNNATGTTNSNVAIPFMLTAVNGNNFMLPTLNLHIDNGSFTAYTGCNNAVGTIVVNGSSLRFEEAAATANVECIGGFDQAAFMDRLRRADSYDVVDNQFRLKQGDQVLMVFAKNAQ